MMLVQTRADNGIGAPYYRVDMHHDVVALLPVASVENYGLGAPIADCPIRRKWGIHGPAAGTQLSGRRNLLMPRVIAPSFSQQHKTELPTVA